MPGSPESLRFTFYDLETALKQDGEAMRQVIDDFIAYPDFEVEGFINTGLEVASPHTAQLGRLLAFNFADSDPEAQRAAYHGFHFAVFVADCLFSHAQIFIGEGYLDCEKDKTNELLEKVHNDTQDYLFYRTGLNDLISYSLPEISVSRKYDDQIETVAALTFMLFDRGEEKRVIDSTVALASKALPDYIPAEWLL